jgi:hypothetical protein
MMHGAGSIRYNPDRRALQRAAAHGVVWYFGKLHQGGGAMQRNHDIIAKYRAGAW